MQDEEVECDNAKAATDLARHRVAFALARQVFDDPFALDWRDERADYGEERYATVGAAQGRILFVAYTMRGDRIRIISARGATPHERKRYHEEKA
jgi:uncharacterized protein